MLSVADPDFSLLLGSTDPLLGQAPRDAAEKLKISGILTFARHDFVGEIGRKGSFRLDF